MNKKQGLLLFLCAGSLYAVEPPVPASGTVHPHENEYTFGHDSLRKNFEVKRKTFYRLNCIVESVSCGQVVSQISGFSDKTYNHYKVWNFEPGKTSISLSFYAPEDAILRFHIFNRRKKQGSTSVTISRLTLNIEDFSALKKQNLPDVWTPRGQTGKTNFILKTVPADDHIDGGTAVEFTPEPGTKGGIQGLDFNAAPNRTFRLTFWAKGDREGKIKVWVDGWASRRKHFYVEKVFLLSTEFQEFTIIFKTPEDIDRYVGRLRPVVMPERVNKLQIKGFVIEENEKK